MKTIMRVLFGSHLYGLNTPASDFDYMAIHLPSWRDILLQRVKDSVKEGPSKEEGQRNQPGDTDKESYSLQRYLELLAQGQTGPLDMLFAPDSNLLVKSPTWTFIRENKDKLLTRRSAAFVGYCRDQANKYGVKGSRVASVERASQYFTEAQTRFGSTAKIGEVLNEVPYGNFDEFTKIVEKDTTPGHSETYFECCTRMMGFKNTVKEAAKVYTRIYEAYGERAQKAKNNEGIDWKALSHAVRVGYEALDLLTTGEITFPFTGARRDHLIDIKLGRLTYRQVADEIETLLPEVESAAETSSLPDDVDRVFIDELVTDAYDAMVVSRAA